MPKVLYIGFGLSPFSEGGAIDYQESLMEVVNAKGWQTAFFCAVPRYTRPVGNRPYLKQWHKNNTKIIELYNTPNMPGWLTPPNQQCHELQIQKLTEDVLNKERPDIVHLHELQAHCASIIDTIYNQKIPSLKSIHNYYDICPQRDLMYMGNNLCFDFEEGKKCAKCILTLPAKKSSFTEGIREVLFPSCKGSIYEPIFYSNRRKFFVEELNKLDIIHCSSKRSAEILINYGLRKEKIRIITLSSRSLDEIYPKPLRDSRFPVVFGYIGGGYLHKGYKILIEAFSRIEQSKAKLIIWNVKPHKIETPNKKYNIELRARYAREELKRVLGEVDVGVVPSIWEETFGIIGIEFLKAKIPVIGSNIGGIPEWLKDGKGAFLVSPSNAEQLFQQMEAFVRNPQLIAQEQEKIEAWKTFDEHAEEIIALYEDVTKNKL